jgi:hypothetical protein
MEQDDVIEVYQEQTGGRVNICWRINFPDTQRYIIL